jgi:hypothetical protein
VFAALPPSAVNWSFVKIDISRMTGVPDDALHVLAGMMVLLIAAYLLRRPPWTWQAWIVVVAAETINETYDLLQTVVPSDEGNFRASLHDFWLTLLWPTIVLLAYPRFVGVDPDAGRLAPMRRAVLSRPFAIAFGVVLVIGIALLWWAG